ncbi:glutamate N-acetyltransferase/amino-acid acetyltransferase [Tremella mesenterica]|uniref:Arginine biosynthesis bifunctional protein ArgJ, mitochondrial n=1 Tax=Tremella mesenterica TaxID=5217 RepID=A0A4Q1BD31_TREME|nr:glutamate N-acetyltransferase/amino-acid acetyltransferase [Tremella mesenterica]
MPPLLVPTVKLPRLKLSIYRSFSSSGSSRTATTSPSKPAMSKDRHIITYSPEAFPLGFSVSSVHSGIKKKPGALDLGILISTSDSPCSAAACLTQNVFKAAPVTVTSSLLHRHQGRARGMIINSGCANAVTGKKGLEDAWAMSDGITRLLPPGEGGTLVMSTGVIGQHLPFKKIAKSLPELVQNLSDSPKAWLDLAKASMTTDAFPKLRARTFILGGRKIRLAGIDKGAGMIAPKMGPPQPPHATLLGMIATDAAVEPKALQNALNYAVERSFNNITVDGDMSTNDTILCFANGAAGKLEDEGRPSVGKMEEINEKSEGYDLFREELKGLAEELAQLIVRDGEGATKFVTIRVKGAQTYDIANAVARSVATSSLVKTALYGEDANWGRILAAIGYSSVPPNTLQPSNISVSFLPPSTLSVQPLRVVSFGEPEKVDEALASVLLAEEDIHIEIDLGSGKEEATLWTCDLSHVSWSLI